jgi:hypothetical protein
MPYVIALTDCEWDAVADLLETVDPPVEGHLVERIRNAVSHQRHGCVCRFPIELSAAQADAVHSVLPRIESVGLAVAPDA